ncbi:hypothetical protein FDP41_007659 [Naegleria fowleri]|uniref:Uncharacterized protein n=1 Tax=Naegleria fowleri TaxID=5763 RepID=A0A6A5CB16_NAEFO|nr:uncharacterized protein FDP41_007659 [Naegleria fowleri]KAF0983744.1 hypothetical protein FDP41_007659 [Naegleria fowleri]CAG4713900.1 unnamed protein product [Naegleria fowleri]
MPFVFGGFHLPSPKSAITTTNNTNNHGNEQQTRPQQNSEEGTNIATIVDDHHNNTEAKILEINALSKREQARIQTPFNQSVGNDHQQLENHSKDSMNEFQLPTNTPKKFNNSNTNSKTPQLIPSSLGKRKQSLNNSTSNSSNSGRKNQVVINNFLPEDDKNDINQRRRTSSLGKMQQLTSYQEEEYDILKPNKYEDYLEHKRKRTHSNENEQMMSTTMSTPSSSSSLSVAEDDDDDLLASVTKTTAASIPLSANSTCSSNVQKTPSSKSPAITFNIPKRNANVTPNQPEQQQQNR